QWYPESNGDYSQVVANLKVPTGPIHLVVRPTNTDLYMADTVAVTVPQGTQHLIEVSLRFKVHRIHFRITNANTRPVANAKLRLMNTSADLDPNLTRPYISLGGQSPCGHYRNISLTGPLHRSADGRQHPRESPGQGYGAVKSPRSESVIQPDVSVI